MVRTQAGKSFTFAVPMKKSFYISVTFLLILFLTIMTGLSSDRKNNAHESHSKDQVGLKSSEAVQHGMLFIASMAENDFDADKAFFDLPFILFAYHKVLWGINLNSNVSAGSASESVHHYHLPKYLLFHNLKISIS
ncbi:hypothetical protein DBR39_24025 [Chryseobacterium sp. KBW03]|nr:hypothetical protein DBR39_24025 [Chryseobacterium sp. KBW03]